MSKDNRSDIMLTETIKRENKYFKLGSEYVVTPSFVKNSVINQKPLHIMADAKCDDEVINVIKRSNMTPNEKYSEAILSSHEYGWNNYETIRNPFFHRPRIVSEISKLYRPS